MTEEAKATRERNLKAQAKRFEEQAACISTARLALQRITEDKDATAEDVLEAMRLLAEISK